MIICFHTVQNRSKETHCAPRTSCSTPYQKILRKGNRLFQNSSGKTSWRLPLLAVTFSRSSSNVGLDVPGTRNAGGLHSGHANLLVRSCPWACRGKCRNRKCATRSRCPRRGNRADQKPERGRRGRFSPGPSHRPRCSSINAGRNARVCPDSV